MGRACMCEWTPVYSLQADAGVPLAHSGDDFTLRAINGLRKVRIQASPSAVVDVVVLAGALGASFPESPQEPVATLKTAYWQAPNDWLILDSDEEEGSLEVALRSIARGNEWVVTDVSDAVSVIELAGNGASARLREGCSVDLDVRAFPPGRYALTRLQNLPVTLHRVDGAHRFRLLVDRSYARFLWDWLATADFGKISR